MYIPKNKFNLFSVTKWLTNEWYIGGDGKSIWIRKNKQTIKFDIKINTREIIIFAMYVNLELPTQEVDAACAYCRMKVDIHKAHE